MTRRITRRDFLDGVAVTAGMLAIGGCVAHPGTMPATPAPEKAASYYPPALTGLRGSYNATYQVAHALRDNTFWQSAGAAQQTGETYDLVVVGGGISGLAAAHFYKKAAGARARILILDPHDDFGGHAKRNEFRYRGRMLLSNGGTQSIESPGLYSGVAKQVLRDIGIETKRFYTDYDQTLYSSMHLGTGMFFDKETFGEDRLVAGMGDLPWPVFLAQAPLSDMVRKDVAQLYAGKKDYLPGMTAAQRRARLLKTSYADFLTKIAGCHLDVLPLFQKTTHDLWGVGIDAVSALECYEGGDDYGFTYPGFQGMNLNLESGGHGTTEEPYIFHFPDGNATVARLLVRSLIPSAVPGNTMEDVVTARASYAQLDDDVNSVRIRLSSTAVRVKQNGPEVEVQYVRLGQLQSVRAKSCVLACWNGVIPYLCPELPDKQKQAMHYGVKVPLVYTHVLLRNWKSFYKLGVSEIAAPGSYHSYVSTDFPVSIGTYKFPKSPSEPMVLFMLRTPCKPGLPAREQFKAGRFELYNTPFSTFERNIRDQLARTLVKGGFDPARDIEAITVNRWAHGYAYEYMSLWDPDWPPHERPCVVARKPFGRITIANSDAGARAYTDCAIDQAHRAVNELLTVT
jgi:spermidine dehydrogenase